MVVFRALDRFRFGEPCVRTGGTDKLEIVKCLEKTSVVRMITARDYVCREQRDPVKEMGVLIVK